MEINCHTPSEMVLIPPGEFLMGIPDEEVYIDPRAPSLGDTFRDSHPQQSIWTDAFYIDRYPVTNAQYYEFVVDTKWRLPLSYGSWSDVELGWDSVTGRYQDGMADYPVVFASWYDAAYYCEWAGKRLPTEAEWEKAARGIDGRRYPWGDSERDGCHHPSPLCKPRRPLSEELCSVYQYPDGVSPYGCHQMFGNVGEWCSDWYSEAYPKRRPCRNPRGPGTRKHKTVRGFIIYPHVAYRKDPHEPWFGYPWVGFRCARDAPREVAP